MKFASLLKINILTLILFVGCHKSSSKIVDEPLYQEQWALHYNKPFYEAYGINPEAHIHAEDSFLKYSGKGIKVAIIDIGFDVNHFEYKNNIIKVINSADGSDNVKCSTSDECYHGSAVTGIIASNINQEGLKGIAPDVELILIKLDLAGYIGDNEIYQALDYAQKENVDIINCSWGTGFVTPVIEDKLNQISKNTRNDKGTIIVFSSGNKGKENNDDESMLDSVIGVGSSDEDNLRAIYSNFGKGLDIVAPGGYSLGITTTNETQEDKSLYIQAEDYKKFQGTSASAPIVTGAIALLLEKNSNLTKKELFDILHNSSDKIGNVEYVDDKNDYYGYGKINIDKMLLGKGVIN